MVDFSKLLNQTQSNKKLDPIEIYETIDRKSDTGPLRLAQEDILTEWYSKKEEKDLVVKLNTGEGKTLIGLLILQSVINAKEGPSLYICPNKYLVNQVCNEAKKFGISYCTINGNEIPSEFLSGEKILITHAQKIFNGKSIFGLNNEYTETGTVILDDSHACIDTIKDAFCMTIDREKSERLYQALLELFEYDLKDQGEGTFLDIKNKKASALTTVPYWCWFNKKSEVLEIISKYMPESLQFSWSLIKDSIEQCVCHVTSSKIEISPYTPNIDVFSTLSRAKHRVLMSATTQDDSFLIKGLGININAIKNPLIAKYSKWSGEKMIVIPSLIDDKRLDRNIIVTRFSKHPYLSFGGVAIVPNSRRAIQYANLGATVTNPQNIFDEIDKVKYRKSQNLLVLNNRYDGIDLPDESCRILIIDSMPYFSNLSDIYEKQCRPSSEITNKKIAQKIEQGLGRGVRGEKDYCLILLIGSDLVKFIRSPQSKRYFTLQTQKQIEIGLNIVKYAKEEITNNNDSFEVFRSLMKQSIDRDEGWKQFYSNEMNSISNYSEDISLYERLKEERTIEQNFLKYDYSQASDKLQKYLDNNNFDNFEKGWYLQQLARFLYPINKKKSKQIQQSAFKKNDQLLKPDNVKYKNVSYINENRLERIRAFLSKFENYDELRLSINDIIDSLSFGIDANKFELALKHVGDLLGFISERPDKSIRKGPDNLWCCDNNKFFIFECKNQIDPDRLSIDKTEVGQMNNHSAWFEETYGSDKNVNRILIAPVKDISYQANFSHTVKIIRKQGLSILRKNLKEFINSLHDLDISQISDDTLINLLKIHNLNNEDLENVYCEAPYFLQDRKNYEEK